MIDKVLMGINFLLGNYWILDRLVDTYLQWILLGNNENVVSQGADFQTYVKTSIASLFLFPSFTKNLNCSCA